MASPSGHLPGHTRFSWVLWVSTYTRSIQALFAQRFPHSPGVIAPQPIQTRRIRIQGSGEVWGPQRHGNVGNVLRAARPWKQKFGLSLLQLCSSYALLAYCVGKGTLFLGISHQSSCFARSSSFHIQLIQPMCPRVPAGNLPIKDDRTRGLLGCHVDILGVLWQGLRHECLALPVLNRLWFVDVCSLSLWSLILQCAGLLSSCQVFNILQQPLRFRRYKKKKKKKQSERIPNGKLKGKSFVEKHMKRKVCPVHTVLAFCDFFQKKS